MRRNSLNDWFSYPELTGHGKDYLDFASSSYSDVELEIFEAEQKEIENIKDLEKIRDRSKEQGHASIVWKHASIVRKLVRPGFQAYHNGIFQGTIRSKRSTVSGPRLDTLWKQIP